MESPFGEPKKKGTRIGSMLKEHRSMSPMQIDSPKATFLPSLPGNFRAEDTIVRRSFDVPDSIKQSGSDSNVQLKSVDSPSSQRTSSAARRFYARDFETQHPPPGSYHDQSCSSCSANTNTRTRERDSASHHVEEKPSKKWSASTRPSTSAVDWWNLLGNDKDPVSELLHSVEWGDTYTELQTMNAKRSYFETFGKYAEYQKTKCKGPDTEEEMEGPSPPPSRNCTFLTIVPEEESTKSKWSQPTGRSCFDRDTSTVASSETYGGTDAIQNMSFMQRLQDNYISISNSHLKSTGSSETKVAEYHSLEGHKTQPESQLPRHELRPTVKCSAASVEQKRPSTGYSSSSLDSGITQDLPEIALNFPSSGNIETPHRKIPDRIDPHWQRKAKFTLSKVREQLNGTVDETKNNSSAKSMNTAQKMKTQSFYTAIGKRHVQRCLKKRNERQQSNTVQKSISWVNSELTNEEQITKTHPLPYAIASKQEMKRMRSKAGALGDILGKMLRKNGLYSTAPKINDTRYTNHLCGFGASMIHSSSKKGGNSNDPMKSSGGVIIESANSNETRALVRETRVLAVRRGDAIAARAMAAGIRQFYDLQEKEEEDRILRLSEQADDEKRSNEAAKSKIKSRRKSISDEELKQGINRHYATQAQEKLNQLTHVEPKKDKLEETTQDLKSVLQGNDPKVENSSEKEVEKPKKKRMCNSYADVRSEEDLRRLLRVEPGIANPENATGSAKSILGYWSLFTQLHEAKKQNSRRRLGTKITSKKVRRLWTDAKRHADSRDALSLLKWHEEYGIPIDSSKMMIIEAQIPKELLEAKAAEEREQRLRRWRKIAPLKL